MKKNNVSLYSIFPLVVSAVVIIAFIAATGGSILSSVSIIGMLQKLSYTLIGCSGMIFVIAIGEVDMSLGSAVGVTAVLAALVSSKIGWWAFVPVSLLTGLLIGLFNGVIVTKFKVSSFMTTFAMLTALRAVCQVFLGKTGTISVTKYVGFFAKTEWMLGALILVVIVVYYVLEYTKFGYYCKAIGENETACRYAGIPVDAVKGFAFGISGFLAGFAGMFISAIGGGPTVTTGVSFELNVMMAIFLGGVLITGGMRSRMYKVIIGAVTIIFLKNGLTIIGVSSKLNEAIRGVLLIAIIASTTYLNNQANARSGNKMIKKL